MALRWKPTIPDDDNPDDVVGSLHLHVFARVYRVPTGSDQGRFRWYLKDVPASAGVQLQGVEDTRKKAQQTANFHFQQWLERAGLREAPVRAKRQLALAFQKHSAPKGADLNRKEKSPTILAAHDGSSPREVDHLARRKISPSHASHRRDLAGK